MRRDSFEELGNTVFLVDVLCTIITFLGAFWARDMFLSGREELSFNSHLFLIPLVLVLVTVSLSWFGGYRAPYRTGLPGYIWAIVRAVAVAVGILLALLFFLNIQYVSRLVILLFAVSECFVLLTVRLGVIAYFRDRVKSGKNRLRVLVVGSRTRARELVAALRQHVVWGVDIVGFIDPDPACVGHTVDDIAVIGTVDTIHDCLKHNVVDEVIVAIPRSLLDDAEPIVQACEEEGIRLRFMADLFNVKVARISLSQIRDIPLLDLEPIVQDRQQLLAKRLIDLSVATIALPLLSPLFLLVAIGIKLDSPGPIFFVQHRVGARKRIFKMYKFRSMHIDAEKRLQELEHLNEANGPIFKMKNDPRITSFGRFLRKTSIDELPQLINVFRGEMSLVGPRPMSFRDVEQFDRGIQRKRFSVQPGLTCIWQVSGRSDLPFDKWLEMDLEYIDNWSLWLDLKILLQTIPAVIRAKGAA